jgi:hypothetical protein
MFGSLILQGFCYQQVQEFPIFGVLRDCNGRFSIILLPYLNQQDVILILIAALAAIAILRRKAVFSRAAWMRL